jgi:hypothetical protein
VEVILAQTDLGRGILGVIDGFSSKGIETEADIEKKKGFLRMIGYISNNVKIIRQALPWPHCTRNSRGF